MRATFSVVMGAVFNKPEARSDVSVARSTAQATKLPLRKSRPGGVFASAPVPRFEPGGGADG